MSLANRFKQDGNLSTTRSDRRPLWRGPELDGITYSLLSRFLVCRERFRLLVVEGLRPADHFNYRAEFGSMWHVCEEMSAAGENWESPLAQYAKCLCAKYPTDQGQIDHWYNVCKLMFPRYLNFWRDHPDVKDRTPLLQEQVFDVPYLLPSGRTVRLRGKWDSVDLIGKGGSKGTGIYLQENKTKSNIWEEGLQRQLTFDLQTMLYIIALKQRYKTFDGHPILGVRYNVVRRPLQRQGKRESKQDFYERLGRIIDEDQAHFFMRWKVEVNAADIAKFKRECLDPILEQLCDWWNWISGRKSSSNKPVNSHIHWRHPFGVYNVLNEGGSSDLDEYLATGSEVGLIRVNKLFEELE